MMFRGIIQQRVPVLLRLRLLRRTMNNYETVFILTPVLSDAQAKEAVDKFIGVLTEAGATIVNHETRVRHGDSWSRVSLQLQVLRRIPPECSSRWFSYR